MLQDNWAKAVFSELWEGTAKMVGAVKSTLGWCGVFLAAMLSASTTQAQTVSQGGPGGPGGAGPGGPGGGGPRGPGQRGNRPPTE